jgi:hypothetical protein
MGSTSALAIQKLAVQRPRALARPSRPLAIAAATFTVYVAFVACSIGRGYSPADFALVGRSTHPPTPTLASYAPPGVSKGYDGQFALFIALDPSGARRALDDPAYRYSHILYPLLARASALGRPSLVPIALLVVNLLAVATATFAVARLLQRLQVSPWPALLLAFYPGMLLSVGRDLNEPVAFALVALALDALSWDSRRRVVAAAVLFAAAGLARETTLLFPAVLAVCQALQARRLRQPLILALAAVPYAVWSLTLRYGLHVGGGRPPLAGYPLQGIVGAPHLRTFQAIVVVAPVLLLLAALAATLIHRRAPTPSLSLLGAQIALTCSLGAPSFADWPSSSRLQLGVLLSALLAFPQLRARRLQYAATVLAFAPAVPLVVLLFAKGPM